MGGIMDYKARFYSPYLNQFLQPDTIIPDQFNPQSWNRFSYGLNNPIKYNDPDGHCPICISAAIGAAIGFAFSYGSEVYKNTQEGKSLSEAMSFENIDVTKVVAATVGGLVAGATMGFAAPALAGALTSEIAAYGIAGGLASSAGGIAESLTVASGKQIENSISKGSWTWDRNKFAEDAKDAGLTPGDIAFNIGVGGLLSMGSYGLIRPITGPIRRIPNAMFFDDAYFESKGYLVGFGASVVKTSVSVMRKMIKDELKDQLAE
jgi:RHS repeat-associated protein